MVELSWASFWQAVKRRWWLVACFMCVAMALASYVSFYLMTPMYEARAQLLINQKSEDYSWTQMETDLHFINTYNIIVTSPVILTQVIEELQLDVTVSQLASMITVSNESESKVVQIAAHSEGREQAARLANTVARIFQQNIPTLMHIDNVTILSTAHVNSVEKVKPNESVTIVLATLAGLVASIGVICVLEMLDQTVKTVADVEGTLHWPIIGFVSPMNGPAMLKDRRKKHAPTKKSG